MKEGFMESFVVRNFRLFRSVELPSLGRVNLFVGKNNSGKSALLEAIQVLATEASPHLMWDLIRQREETWEGTEERIGDEQVMSPIRHLFINHRLPSLNEEGVFLGTTDRKRSLHLRTAAYRTIVDEEEGTRRVVRLNAREAEESDADVDLVLIAENGSRTKRLLSLDGEDRRIRPPWYGFSQSEGGSRVQSVPTRNVPPQDVAALWDLVSLTPLEDEVITGLKLIDDTIEAIAFVETQLRQGRGRRVPLVRTSSFREPVPLNSMGDGVSRLFQIIVALVNARGGVLLVDEFENGLHWSVQRHVWDTVFRLAENLDVQVFSTTHSRDCVEAFRDAWQVNPSWGRFYRLSREDGEVVPVRYDIETLSDAVATDVEVR